MSNDGVCLAEADGLGRVYDCGACGNIHVQIGPISITLEPSAYMQLVAMLSTSASNFELWMQQRDKPGIAGIGETHSMDNIRHQLEEQNPNEPGRL